MRPGRGSGLRGNPARDGPVRPRVDPFAPPTPPRTWRLTPAEAAAAWPGRPPFPLALGAPLRTAPVGPGPADPALAAALGVLARATTTLDAVGWTGPGEGELVRVLAAAAGPAGVLVRQHPGPSAARGGDVEVTEVAPQRLARAVAAALPEAPAGRHAPLRVPALAQPGGVLHRSAGEADDAAGLAALTGARRTGAGQLGVTVAGPGGPVRECALRWLDPVGDGRTLLDARDPALLRVDPVDAEQLGRVLADAARLLAARVADDAGQAVLR